MSRNVPRWPTSAAARKIEGLRIFALLCLALATAPACTPAALACASNDDCPVNARCEPDGACVPAATEPGAGDDDDTGEGEGEGEEGEGEEGEGEEGEGEEGEGEEGEGAGEEGEGEGEEGEGEGEEGEGEDPCLDPDGDGRGPGCIVGNDNCVDVANAGQQDEDGDALGDACDACPLEGDAGIDGDGDGLDVACDPDDGRAGDALVVFDTFETLGPAWTVTQGAWSLDDGALAQDSFGSTAIVLDTNVARVRVHVRIRILAFGGSPTQNVLIGARIDGEADGYLCSARNSSPQTSAVFFMNDTGFPSPADTTTISGGIPLATPIDMILEVDSGVRCSVAGAVSQAAEQSFIDGNDVMIRTDDGRVRVDSIAVYALP